MDRQLDQSVSAENQEVKKIEDSDDDVIEDLEQRAIWEQKKQNQNIGAVRPNQQDEDSDVLIDTHPKRYQQDEGQFFFELNGGKKVCVSRFQGAIMVSIRLYYVNKSGKNLPSKKGIALSLENWAKLKTYVGDVDECIKMIK